MKTRLISGIAALGCLVMASCYPIEEGPRQKPNQGPDKTVTSPDQQKIQEQRDKLKEKAEAEKNQAATAGQTSPGNTLPDTPKPPTEPKRAEYQFADPVPGRPGFVLSPYNKKMVDVRDIPSGTLVQDPTYPAEQKKYFRVP